MVLPLQLLFPCLIDHNTATSGTLCCSCSRVADKHSSFEPCCNRSGCPIPPGPLVPLHCLTNPHQCCSWQGFHISLGPSLSMDCQADIKKALHASGQQSLSFHYPKTPSILAWTSVACADSVQTCKADYGTLGAETLELQGRWVGRQRGVVTNRFT